MSGAAGYAGKTGRSRPAVFEVLAVRLLGATAPAQAQSFAPVPSPAVRCLTPPNQVRQIESQHPERQPCLDWLSQVQLRLPGDLGPQLLGDDVTVRAPCVTLDLQPSS